MDCRSYPKKDFFHCDQLLDLLGDLFIFLKSASTLDIFKYILNHLLLTVVTNIKKTICLDLVELHES